MCLKHDFMYLKCATHFFFLSCSGISLLLLLVFNIPEPQKMEVSQLFSDVWEGQALLFSESIHISCSPYGPWTGYCGMEKRFGFMKWWIGVLTKPNVLVTDGVEPNNSAKLGLAPELLPPWCRFSSKSRLKRDEGNPVCKSGHQL